jgi:hypothetical protein
MNKNAKGPWEVIVTEPDILVKMPSGITLVIGDALYNKERSLDIANFVAAAPDLLEMAQNFRTWWANNFSDFTADINDQLVCLDNEFEQVMAKATGN